MMQYKLNTTLLNSCQPIPLECQWSTSKGTELSGVKGPQCASWKAEQRSGGGSRKQTSSHILCQRWRRTQEGISKATRQEPRQWDLADEFVTSS